MQKKVLDINNISKGAIPEMFQRALNEVLLDINDPNIEREAKRKIIIEVDVEAHESSDIITYETKVKTKLGPKKGVGGMAYFGVNDEETGMEAREYDTSTTPLFELKNAK